MKRVSEDRATGNGTFDSQGVQELPAILRRSPNQVTRLRRRLGRDGWERGGATSARVVEVTPSVSTKASAGPNQIAALRISAHHGVPEDDLRQLAQQLMAEVQSTIEITVQDHWLRRGTYRKSLESSTAQIAQAAVKAVMQDIEAGRAVTPARVRQVVEGAVAEAVDHVPGFFRTENIIGFGLFAAGLTLTGTMNAGLMELAKTAEIGTKLAIQSVVSTCMGYLLACFSPHFNDKASNQSRALNYGIMNRVMGLLGSRQEKHEKATAVDPGTEMLLGEVYIAHESFEARLRGVMTLIREFSLLMSEAFFKARYMLDDQDNPGRMVDACDHLAGAFVTARLVFYALKPEFTDLFETYVYSVLEPLLRKHSSRDGEEMYELIMAKIRLSNPRPSEETLEKYYRPFVRGSLGLDHHQGRGLMGEVNALLQGEIASKAHSG